MGAACPHTTIPSVKTNVEDMFDDTCRLSVTVLFERDQSKKTVLDALKML